jgi:hypothetical protein
MENKKFFIVASAILLYSVFYVSLTVPSDYGTSTEITGLQVGGLSSGNGSSPPPAIIINKHAICINNTCTMVPGHGNSTCWPPGSAC